MRDRGLELGAHLCKLALTTLHFEPERAIVLGHGAPTRPRPNPMPSRRTVQKLVMPALNLERDSERVHAPRAALLPVLSFLTRTLCRVVAPHRFERGSRIRIPLSALEIVHGSRPAVLLAVGIDARHIGERVTLEPTHTLATCRACPPARHEISI